MVCQGLCLSLYTKVICRHPQEMHREALEQCLLGLATKLKKKKDSFQPFRGHRPYGGVHNFGKVTKQTSVNKTAVLHPVF